MTDGDSPREPKQHGSVRIPVGLLLATVIAFAARYHFGRAPEGEGVLQEASKVTERLRAQHRTRWAQEVSAESAKDPCLGAERAATRGLDADLASEVLSLLDLSNKHCPTLTRLRGLRAEALTRAGQTDAGEREAGAVLKTTPNDAHALTARALGYWRSNRGAEALTQAQRAIDAGRGRSAYLLKGLIAYASKQLDVAEASFRALLELEPDDVEGVYNLALVQQQKNRYHAAREGYLRVLRLEPTRADARFNLALLAHSIGASDEAKHHLAKLRGLAASGAQVAKLEALLATPAGSARPTASSPGFSLVLGAHSAPRAAAPPQPSAR